ADAHGALANGLVHGTPRANVIGRGKSARNARAGPLSPSAGERPGPAVRLRPRAASDSALALAGDELLELLTTQRVLDLDGRGLHEVGRRGVDRAADAAVLGDLRRADRVDDDAGRVGRVPHLELVLEVEGHLTEGRALEADVRPLAVVEPRDVVGRADVDIGVVLHAG